MGSFSSGYLADGNRAVGYAGEEASIFLQLESWDGSWKSTYAVNAVSSDEAPRLHPLHGGTNDGPPKWKISVPDGDAKAHSSVWVTARDKEGGTVLHSDSLDWMVEGFKATVQAAPSAAAGQPISVDEPAGSSTADKPSVSYTFKPTPGNTLLAFALDSGKSLSEYPLAEARQILVDTMSQCLGLTADLGNATSAVRDAYCDLLNLWDDIPHERWAPKDHSNAASSCGLFIRSMWRLLGARHSLLGHPCYQNIPVAYPTKMKAVRKLDALKSSKNVDELPKTGDVIYIWNKDVKSPNHIFTLSQDTTIEGNQLVMSSIDGGQSRSAGDAPSLGIWPRKRHLNRTTLIFDEDPAGNKRPVTTWVSFELLLPQFKAKMIRLTRKDTITEEMKTPTTSGAA